jgi:hypothetical protein
MRIVIPRLAANIERRLLINYRLDPAVAQSLLPGSLRPQLVDGSAVAGICLLRLGALRPALSPLAVGWGAENAAHRIAVEWDDHDGTHSGVYVPERHSASWLPVLVGGRVFPGVHHHAEFDSAETDDRFQVSMKSGEMQVDADVRRTDDWDSSLFASVSAASEFFRSGSVGWSPDRRGNRLQGLKLETTQWHVDPVRATRVRSSFFDSLPTGSATLDCVLLMRNVPITWSVPKESEPRAELTFAR